MNLLIAGRYTGLPLPQTWIMMSTTAYNNADDE
jgi:hypothetical protein